MKKKILLIVIFAAILAASATGIVFGVNFYGKHSRYPVSENLAYIRYNNGKYAVVDSQGKRIGKRFDEVLSRSSKYLVFRKGNKCGFISTQSGEVIFAPQFDYAWIDNPQFGLAAVALDNKLGFVNVNTGTMAIAPQFEFDGEISDGRYYYYVFKNSGYCEVPGKNSKIGIIDTTGKLILPCQYSDIVFTDGFVKIQLEDKYGLYDTLFNMVLPPVYDWLKVNDFGIAVLEHNYHTGHKQYLFAYNGVDVMSKLWLDEMDYEGIIAEPFYEPTERAYSNENQRKRSRFSKFRIYNRYGVFDEHFNIIIPAKYTEINYIGNGYFGCLIHSEGVIVDAKGELVHRK